MMMRVIIVQDHVPGQGSMQAEKKQAKRSKERTPGYKITSELIVLSPCVQFHERKKRIMYILVKDTQNVILRSPEHEREKQQGRD